MSNKGIADNWIEFIIKCISEPLGWSEEVFVLFSKNTENAEKININKITYMTDRHNNPTKEFSLQNRKQPQKPAVKPQFNDLEEEIKALNGKYTQVDFPYMIRDGIQIVVLPGAEEISKRGYADNKALKRIYIQDSVRRIKRDAFKNSSVTEVLGMNGVTVIEPGAFEGCISLKSITLPDGLTNIGERAFAFCMRLKSITLPDGLTNIEKEAFYFSRLTDITIPASVIQIGKNAFKNTSLQSITLPYAFKKNIFKKISKG